MLLKAAILLSICLALSQAEMPWMARMQVLLQPRSRAMVETSCHSFSTEAMLGMGGAVPLLHFCDFPEYRNELCAFTTLRECCRTVAVTEQLARSIRFEEIEFSGTTYRVQFYQTGMQGVCYISEPPVSELCFECQEPLDCVDIGSGYCEDGVNFDTCIEGECSCREGHRGDDCCECSTADNFFRNTDSGMCETCQCCAENIVGGSSECDRHGNCSECMEGFTGPKCCDPVATVGPGAGGEFGVTGCGTPCIIGIVVGIILAILLFLLLLLLIYGLYRYKNQPNTKIEETGTGIGGDARDNPLYIEPATVVEDTQ